MPDLAEMLGVSTTFGGVLRHDSFLWGHLLARTLSARQKVCGVGHLSVTTAGGFPRLGP